MNGKLRELYLWSALLDELTIKQIGKRQEIDAIGFVISQQ